MNHDFKTVCQSAHIYICLQEEILKTKTHDEIMEAKEQYIATAKEGSSRPPAESKQQQQVQQQHRSVVSADGAAVAGAMDQLAAKEQGGEATEGDYAAFADEITKWLAEQDQPKQADVDW